MHVACDSCPRIQRHAWNIRTTNQCWALIIVWLSTAATNTGGGCRTLKAFLPPPLPPPRPDSLINVAVNGMESFAPGFRGSGGACGWISTTMSCATIACCTAQCLLVGHRTFSSTLPTCRQVLACHSSLVFCDFARQLMVILTCAWLPRVFWSRMRRL